MGLMNVRLALIAIVAGAALFYTYLEWRAAQAELDQAHALAQQRASSTSLELTSSYVPVGQMARLEGVLKGRAGSSAEVAPDQFASLVDGTLCLGYRIELERALRRTEVVRDSKRGSRTVTHDSTESGVYSQQELARFLELSTPRGDLRLDASMLTLDKGFGARWRPIDPVAKNLPVKPVPPGEAVRGYSAREILLTPGQTVVVEGKVQGTDPLRLSGRIYCAPLSSLQRAAVPPPRRVLSVWDVLLSMKGVAVWVGLPIILLVWLAPRKAG